MVHRQHFTEKTGTWRVVLGNFREARCSADMSSPTSARGVPAARRAAAGGKGIPAARRGAWRRPPEGRPVKVDGGGRTRVGSQHCADEAVVGADARPTLDPGGHRPSAAADATIDNCEVNRTRGEVRGGPTQNHDAGYAIVRRAS